MLSLRQEMFDLIRYLKAGSKVYAMSNLSEYSWTIVRNAGVDQWEIFDDVFISGSVEYRKPETPFYKHVFRETLPVPLGSGLSFTTAFSNVERAIRNLCGNPVARATTYLINNSKKLHSYASTGHIIHGNLCQLTILEATQDPSLVDYLVYEA